MTIAIALHALAASVWVGGMFFAYMALRPAAATLDPALRCRLWRDVLARFFRYVWMAVALLLATGYWMVLGVLGGMGAVGAHVHAMQGLGIAMMLLFVFVWFTPFRALGRAVDAGDWSSAGRQIGRIRRLVAVNLALGLIVVAVATAGRWM